MREKGQITIEAIIIFGALILIFIGVSVPLAFKVKDAATDVMVVSDARYAAEQIVAVANSISTPGEKRTVEVYIPGYTSVGTVATEAGVRPLIWIGTGIGTNDGSNLTTMVGILRLRDDGTLKQSEIRSFTKSLYGGSWTINGTGFVTYLPPNVTLPSNWIGETQGGRYEVITTWDNTKNIEFRRK